ncbi:MAG TPA: SMC-Scp complex subunit ScpB [bacterium]|nr:SMC-Scp complex subunit ScpB [bacterium]HPO07825.1 SMC-Scp complex subunit ScpB [bacterium]HQO35268.1 SMC-Scp complex subunit ScpB [bacterium]HQQ00919.1 SMC-Scp complex subunit ScpB [bacterium]
MEISELKPVMEALLFVSGDPLPLRRLSEILETDLDIVKLALDDLAADYAARPGGLQLLEVAGGYQLRTRQDHAVYVRRMLERKKKITISGPALETLAIIAYRQPLTRAEIEAIRGVSVDGVLRSLLDKRLVKVAGVKEVPGRPNLYKTTRTFLEFFGLNSLSDLPPMEQLEDTFSSQSQVEEETPAALDGPVIDESAQEHLLDENGESTEPIS